MSAATSKKAPSRITVEEIMKDLGVGRRHVYQMLEQRIIPNIRLVRKYVITREAYQQWKSRAGEKQG